MIRRSRLNFVLIIILAASLLVSTMPVDANPSFQEMTPRSKAEQLLPQLSTQEKVGQLFLATFKGTAAAEGSTAARYINELKVGGFVLERANDNFTAGETSLQATLDLTNGLQQTASAGENYTPLLIGLSQEGDDPAHNQIYNGLNRVPGNLALAATWKPENASAIGRVTGSELSALGFNLFLGPTLDVLDPNAVTMGVNTSTNLFGSNPWWVSAFSESYIRGLRQGSQGRMLIIPRNFPGIGSIDRDPQLEAGTVRKSIEDLKDSDLLPFVNAVQNELIDGLLISNTRFQGFHGNLAELTPPVSLDAPTLSEILSIEPINEWYSGGGVLVTDQLGSLAIRRYYDPTMTSFDARTVARNAFLAGNDLLYLGNFREPNDEDGYATAAKVISAFAQKYNEDQAFAERVDESVLRILTKKFELYPEFNINAVVPSDEGLVEIGKPIPGFFDIAREAATLINPTATELRVALPRVPSVNDQIIVFTDERLVKQCADCAPQPTIPMDGLKTSIMRLYGPSAGGQMNEARITDFSFIDLSRFLDDPTTSQALEVNLKEASWVLFLTQGFDPAYPESTALIDLLDQHPELIAGKKSIAFALGSPYSLDATNVSKLTAYFALYSNTPVFLDTAARLLFQEINPSGTLPVSVPAIGYNLHEMVKPNPFQIIGLELDETEDQPGPATPVPSVVRKFKVEEEIPLRTGVISDKNGHKVPDGTGVTFSFTTLNKGQLNQQYIESTTRNGIARAVYTIPGYGSLEIKAQAGEAKNSQILVLNIIDESGAALATVLPTPSPTPTLEVAPTVDLTPTPTLAPMEVPPSPTSASGWLLTLIVLGGLSSLIAWMLQSPLTLQWSVRLALLGIISGFLTYIAILAGSISLSDLMPGMGNLGLVVVISVGALAGYLIGLIWWAVTRFFRQN